MTEGFKYGTLNIVHFGGDIINTIVTSKEAILAVSREFALHQGLQSLNMRKIAEKCNVSVGSIYNYFPSKADLIAATIQDLWHSIFHIENSPKKLNHFTDYVNWIFESVYAGLEEYPNFFIAHSLSFANTEKGKARQVMEQYFNHMKDGLLNALQNDSDVKATAFSDDFSKSKFVDFVFSNLLTMLMKQENSWNILIEVINRTIY